MLDPMRLQFDIAAMVLRSDDGEIVINESDYALIKDKVIACKYDNVGKTTTYTLEDYDESIHGGPPVEEEYEEGSGVTAIKVTKEEALELVDTLDEATDPVPS